MRVKRLEVQGFKSFKDKTIIHFDHAITGIVGPNGCGKSNIVDAFFWVMGEQSYKHMRGNGSEDLIFNGSTKYSPLGMAEATLVMETDVPDTEHAPTGATAADIPVHLKTKEVSVTRRVYRSGEGEYFINGVPARLKDIHELFMDTGVGAKGYSVIEQGQIGKIVNSKPEERRLLIEEAAGIAKYKARKKESLRKMEATHGNLSRLNDVVQEIERSLGSLERQAQKARQYRKYKDELLDKEMTWGRRKTQVLRQRLESLRQTRDALEHELIGLKAELQVAENEIEIDRIHQLTDSKLAEELQTELQSLSSELTQERSALDLSRRRQGDLTTQLQSLESEKEQLESSLVEERERLSAREIENEGSADAFQKAADEAQHIDQDVRAVRAQLEDARRKLDQSKRELMTGISQASDLNSRAASLAGKIESAKSQAQKLAQQIEAQQARAEAAQQEAARAQEAAEAVRAKKQALQEDRKTTQAQVQTREQALRSAERANQEAGKRLTQLRSRLSSLQELADAHEGFNDGPKAVLDWAKSEGKTAQIRALADALDVNAGYEAALEGWLEEKLQSLVSSDSGVALQALDDIQNRKQGRAAIHIGGESGMDVDSTQTPDLESAGFEVVGELAEFVRINDKIDPALRQPAENILARVCVVKSMEPLTALLAKGANLGTWAIVSLDGQAFHEGVLRGGSIESDHAASVLGRKRAITELETQVAAADAEAQAAEQALADEKQALDAAREQLHELQAQIQALEIEGAALDRDVHQVTRALKEAETQLELSQFDSARMEEEATEALTQQERVQSNLAVLNERRTQLEAQIAEDEARAQARELSLREQEGSLQSLRVNEAQLRERAQGLKRELETARALISDRERRLAEIARVLEKASREHEQHTGGDAGLEERIQTLTLSIAEKKELLSAAKDRLERSSAKLNLTLDRIKELHSIGNERTTESNQMAIEVEKTSGELSHLIQNLEEKYGPGCLERPVTSPIQEEMTEPVVTREMSAEEEIMLGEEVERLRERIRRLGEVNVMAIDEFEDLKKRYDHLLHERSDLEHSIKNLEEAIEHINKTSEERFKKAFEAIAERFERLFPIIFGGGQAKLSLVYPEGSSEILDAGVDILAQPPGKKVTNITLLSGGEKALTAVSLIFAIFMVKPSPFCLLDEVDAPLDDANIGKFNALLREMSVKSQFILITHNKKTMELNDTLYGVTMEEPGVSKMVSIEMH